MAAILQQLSGNPLSTPIGQKIEQATDPSLTSEDWTLIMEVCDMINDTDEGPKDAIRAIRKRLQQNAGKNHCVIMSTLVILEACVKNCGKRFHLLVTNKDFIQELIKLIGPKYDPPAAVQEKVLSLIQTWADTFRGQTEFSGVTQVYNELKQKGIEFPATNLESTAPILTPQRSVPINQQPGAQSIPAAPQQPVIQAVNQASVRNNQNPQTPRHIMSGPVKLTSEQLTKLKIELDIVQGNMKVFSEMLNELVPGKEHADDWELLCQLNNTCHSMQKRLVELIEKVSNEEVTNDLLRINDEMNSHFLRFERYVKKRTQGPNLMPEKEEEASLIDLTEDPVTNGAASAVTDKMSNLNLAKNTNVGATAVTPIGGDADFDVFAQSRSLATEKPAKENSGKVDLDQVEVCVGSVVANKPPPETTNTNCDNKFQREDEFDEMERWLRDQAALQQQQQQQQNPANSGGSQFDRFLAERATAVDRLPNSEQLPNSNKEKDPFGL